MRNKSNLECVVCGKSFSIDTAFLKAQYKSRPVCSPDCANIERVSEKQYEKALSKCVQCGTPIVDPFGAGYCTDHPTPARVIDGKVAWNWCVVKGDGHVITGQLYAPNIYGVLSVISEQVDHLESACLAATIARYDGGIGYVGIAKAVNEKSGTVGTLMFKWQSTVDSVMGDKHE